MNRPTPEKMREHIDAFVEAALQAADPEAAVARALLDAPLWDSAGPPPAPGMAPDSPVRLLSVGKAALSMARGARSILDRRIVDAVIVHPRGLEAADGWPASVRTIAASHPLPDQGSVEAAREAVALATRVLPDETLLVLLSGGGSSLLAMPREGISLDDLRGVNDALLRAGADIEQLNAVRRALSKIKGGRLGRMVAAATRKVVLVLSDVAGDGLETIASGPMIPSTTGDREALAVLERFGLLSRFPRIASVLGAGIPPDPRPIPRCTHRVVASNRTALRAVQACAQRHAFTARFVAALDGEARQAGRRVAESIRYASTGRPLCLLWGGETTVTVHGDGRGGRNHEIALAAALALDGLPACGVASFATDGVDGTSGAAGAYATGETVARAREVGLDPEESLARNDSGGFFAALGTQIVTGPTGTNVADVTIGLVYP